MQGFILGACDKVLLKNKVLPTLFLVHLKTKVFKRQKMRKGIHPEHYRIVAFKDMSNGDVFLTRSTANTKETLEVDGTEYPLIKLEISRTSHPFYTGKSKLVDTAGRIDKFKSKYAKFKK